MTVLIIGGAYQGKRKVAENLYADLPRIENLHEIVRKMLKEDKDPLSLADTLCGHVITCDRDRLRHRSHRPCGRKLA